MRTLNVLAALLLPGVLAWSQSPEPAKAEKLVKAAVAFAKANGMNRLIMETNQGDGRFHVGSGSQLYIFIYDQAGVCQAIGFNTTALVGKNRIGLQDSTGKFFLKEINNTAKTKGSGWVDYKYPNPQTNAVEDKTSYVELCGDMVVGAGIYKAK